MASSCGPKATSMACRLARSKWCWSHRTSCSSKSLQTLHGSAWIRASFKGTSRDSLRQRNFKQRKLQRKASSRGNEKSEESWKASSKGSKWQQCTAATKLQNSISENWSWNFDVKHVVYDIGCCFSSTPGTRKVVLKNSCACCAMRFSQNKKQQDHDNNDLKEMVACQRLTRTTQTKRFVLQATCDQVCAWQIQRLTWQSYGASQDL